MHWHSMFHAARCRFEDEAHAHFASRGDPFGGPFGGRGRGFDDFDGPRGGRGGGGFGGRMFATGDLRLLLLSLIEQQPRHGYELIRTIEEMFDGQYSPSPGAIYPTLTMLEEQGFARVDSETGGKKLYVITAGGEAFLAENRDALNALTLRLGMTARSMARMSAPQAIRAAMHELRHALLAHHHGWDATETARITAILEKAAADIVGPARDRHG
jgi:DNA-binding PadR family transcriptional regulator